MISEPEMAGEFGAVETREVMGDFDRVFVGERRPGKPWLWALGGMVMASALWAALFLYGLGDRKPDMHGYRLDQNPCPSLQLKSIGAAIAPRESTTKFESGGLLNHAALDQVQCFIPLRSRARAERPGNGWSIDYTVGITVALHKKTDPGAEFEALQRVTEFGVDPEAKLETVPDLGDKAYLLTRDDGNSELRVLEGGAVLSLRLSTFTQYQSDEYSEAVAGNGPDIPDLSPYQSAMISDMRDLMSRFKQ